MKKETMDLIVAIICTICGVTVIGVVGYWAWKIHWTATLVWVSLAVSYVLYHGYIKADEE